MLDFAAIVVKFFTLLKQYLIFLMISISNKKDGNRDQWVLLDIGQANNIYTIYFMNEEVFGKTMQINECKLVIYTAEITNEHNYRDISEATLLYKFQALIPIQGKDGYHHRNVTVHLDGLLMNYFGTFDVENNDR